MKGRKAKRKTCLPFGPKVNGAELGVKMTLIGRLCGGYRFFGQ